MAVESRLTPCNGGGRREVGGRKVGMVVAHLWRWSRKLGVVVAELWKWSVKVRR